MMFKTNWKTLIATISTTNLVTAILVAIALLLSACGQSPSANEDDIAGLLFLWHPFQGKEATIFNQILDNYEGLHPDVRIIREYVPESEMDNKFLKRLEAGVGPDLIINEYLYLIELIQAKALRSLDEAELDLSIYLPRPLSQTRIGEDLFALPFSSTTQVLCYNRDRIQQIPKTLTELANAIRQGNRIGITSSFLDTFWGQSIFARPDEGPDPYFKSDAWAKWLRWLQLEKKDANFILAKDRQSLHEAFAKGELDYYLCQSIEISDLKERFGQDKLGVALIPGGENTVSRPLLYAKVIAFSQVVSTQNLELGLQVTQFLTNVQQQTKLALETESLIPVNRNVKLDSRLSPIQAVLYEQLKASVAVPLDYVYFRAANDLSEQERLYDLVLEGELSAQEAAQQINQDLEKRD